MLRVHHLMLSSGKAGGNRSWILVFAPMVEHWNRYATNRRKRNRNGMARATPSSRQGKKLGNVEWRSGGWRGRARGNSEPFGIGYSVPYWYNQNCDRWGVTPGSSVIYASIASRPVFNLIIMNTGGAPYIDGRSRIGASMSSAL